MYTGMLRCISALPQAPKNVFHSSQQGLHRASVPNSKEHRREKASNTAYLFSEASLAILSCREVSVSD